VNFSYSSDSSYGNPITGYQVVLVDTDTNTVVNTTTDSGDATTTSEPLTGLVSGGDYEVEVYGINAYGTSSTFGSVTFTDTNF
jgi:hypothetical protein